MSLADSVDAPSSYHEIKKRSSVAGVTFSLVFFALTVFIAFEKGLFSFLEPEPVVAAKKIKIEKPENIVLDSEPVELLVEDLIEPSKKPRIPKDIPEEKIAEDAPEPLIEEEDVSFFEEEFKEEKATPEIKKPEEPPVKMEIQVRTVTKNSKELVADGYSALIRGSFNIALDNYKKALEIEPENIQALLGKGATLHKLKRYSKARNTYEEALKVEPLNREAVTNILALLGLESPDVALQRLKELEKTAPDFSPIYAQIGMIYANKGEYLNSVYFFQKAVDITPKNMPYLYNLAIMQDRAEMQISAIKSYSKILNSMQAKKSSVPASRIDIINRLNFLKGQ